MKFVKGVKMHVLNNSLLISLAIMMFSSAAMAKPISKPKPAMIEEITVHESNRAMWDFSETHKLKEKYEPKEKLAGHHLHYFVGGTVGKIINIGDNAQVSVDYQQYFAGDNNTNYDQIFNDYEQNNYSNGIGIITVSFLF